MWPTHYLPNQPRVEGIPPPRYYLTTPPYPLEVSESMESNPGPPDLGFSPSLDGLEMVSSNGAFISGVLNDILGSFDSGIEYIWSDGAFISGTLVERLKRITIETNEIESNGAFISGYLGLPLVIYDNWPLGFETEDLISAGQPVSGALT